VIRREAGEVYSKALAVSLGVYVVNRYVETQWARVIHDQILCWATAFASVQIAVILFFSVALVGWRTYARLKENLYDQIRPAIRDRVLALAFEGEAWSSVIPQHGPARQVLEESIAHTLATVKAAGRERVARFAMEHGFAAQWVKAFSSPSKDDRKRAVSLLGLISPVAGVTVLETALADKHPAVRAQAYRALLVAGDTLRVERVFRAVLQESLLMRALLSDDLKRHAAPLSANTIPALLRQATTAEAARCFELLIAWRRAMPSLEIQPWVSGERAASLPLVALSPLVLALLPYVLTDDSIEDYVGAALRSGDPEVQCAAAGAAGRLKMGRLIPVLEGALLGPLLSNSPATPDATPGQTRRLALASATAMAQMGEAGGRALEKIVVGPDRKAAAVAMEALEHITVRRGE